VDELRDLLALYRRLIAARVRAQLQYRTSFALEIAGTLLISFIDFLAILVIFANVPRLAQWTLPEVAMLYAITGLAFAFTDLAIGHLDEFPRLIRDGNFDLLLIRPRGTLFQLLTADFQLRRLGKALGALAVLVYALANLQIDWDLGRIAMLLAVVPFGVAIFASIWIGTICIAFWSVEAREASNAFTYGGQFLSQFPMNVYDQWLRRFLAYIFPIAFVAYFPALYILNKPDPIGLPEWLRFASPLVALAAVLVASAIWRVGVRHYQSAGG
jgi:ABC-2 type transport system permease protein